jgi:cellulose synthase/poly-beta-1,6-N-acetylglucosamine synthase-like glycosyltransferase
MILAWGLQVLALFCAVCAAVLLVPCALLLLQVLMSLRSTSDTTSAASDQSPRPRLAVLMPAHNEEGGIAAAIAAVRAQLLPGDRLLVVADNCSDATAQVAHDAGADVIDRADQQRRGKGYALDFGVRQLERDPPDVVVIVDSDCLVHASALDRLARACISSGRPSQALYLMQSPPRAGLKTRIAEFAWAVKNHARALGFMRLGLPCQLMGSGMAFPWKVIQAAPLASGHIVEDLQLGLDLASAGTPPLFCPQALVTSTFPSSVEGMLAQRTRWEHGHLDVALKVGPPMMWRALSRGRLPMAAMVIDMCVPPLASLVMMLLATLLLSGALSLAGHALALQIVAMASLALAAAVLLAWRRVGSGIVSLGDLLSVPIYVAAKVPLYIQAFTRRQVEWVRTKRDDAPK